MERVEPDFTRELLTDAGPAWIGAPALVRALHPEWTPDEVRSAMVTTAFTTTPGTGDEAHGVLKEDGVTAADPFDMGGGRVDLRSAGRAGLVLDETTAAYEAADPSAGGDPSSLNLPILGDSDCASTCSWTRVVRSKASGDVTWTASVQAPAGLALSVEPSSFTLAPGAAQTLTVTADVRALGSDGWHFGQVVLVPGGDGVPESHLTVAVNRTAGGDFEQVTFHFHGNEHDGCTGVGNVDLAAADPACPDGPTLSTDSELDPGGAALYASNPLLTCAEGFDRCLAEPNWLWRVDGPTTLEGPMTVQFWWTCPACLGTSPVVVFLNEDWEIRLFVDGVEVMNQVVRNLSTLPAQARLVEATVNVPRVTAEERVVLRIEPVFVHQREAAIYYDSSEPCFTSLAEACDSRVHMPVVVERLPDLVVADAGATSDRPPREGEFVTLTATVSVGWDTRGVKGEHAIRITADRGGSVAESAEDNNAGTLTVTVRGNQVTNGSFEQSSDGSSPDAWAASGDTSYDGDSAQAGPTGSWTSEAIDVVAGASYELVARATGSTGLVVVEQLSGAGVVLASVSLPALGALDEVVSVGTGVAQVRIVLKGGLTGTAFDDVGLFER